MSIYPLSRARDLERLIWLKYYIVLKLQITFNLDTFNFGSNATKNTYYIKKSFK